MLYVTVATPLVLKRWVWPMIKCSHLTPKLIYSNIGDLVTDPYLYEVYSLWLFSAFSLVIFCSVSCFKKKTLKIILALINSLKIIYKFIANPLKNSSQSELHYLRISLELNSASPISIFRSNRKWSTLSHWLSDPPIQLDSVSPIYVSQDIIFCSSTQWFFMHILYLLPCCDS
jgi:hypothetical protein